MMISSVQAILAVAFSMAMVVSAQQPLPNYEDGLQQTYGGGYAGGQGGVANPRYEANQQQMGFLNGNQPGGFASNRQPFNYGPNQQMAYSGYPQTPQMSAGYPQMSQMAAAYPQTPVPAAGARGLGPGGVPEGHPSFQNGYECGKCAKEFKRCELACERGKLTYKCVMCIGVKFDKCHQCWVAPQAMPY